VGGIFSLTDHSRLIKGIDCDSKSRITMFKRTQAEKCVNLVCYSRCAVIMQCLPLLLRRTDVPFF